MDLIVPEIELCFAAWPARSFHCDSRHLTPVRNEIALCWDEVNAGCEITFTLLERVWDNSTCNYIEMSLVILG